MVLGGPQVARGPDVVQAWFIVILIKILIVLRSKTTYDNILIQIQLQRKTMQVLVQVYLPSFMFVIVSWISYLVKPEVVPGRMALLVTLFLVLVS